MSGPLPFQLTTLDGIPLAGSGPVILELHPYRIYRNKPDQVHPRFSINQHGFRRCHAVPLNEVRGIIAGASTAFGWPAGDVRCWPTRMEARLSRSLGRPYPILNAGVMGYLLPQIRLYLTEILLDVHPDWVLVVAGWSDWFNIIYHPRAPEHFPYHSTFFHIQNLLGSSFDLKARHPIPLDDLGPAILQSMEREIHRLFRIAKAFHVPLFFVYQPMLAGHSAQTEHEKQVVATLNESMNGYFRYADWFHHALHEQYRRLKETYGNRILWPSPEDLKGRGEIFHDHIHLTLESQDRLAVYFIRHLQQTLNLPGDPIEIIDASPPDWSAVHAVLPAFPTGSFPPDSEVHVRLDDEPYPIVYAYRKLTPGSEPASPLMVPARRPGSIMIRHLDPLHRRPWPRAERLLIQPVPTQPQYQSAIIESRAITNCLPEETDPVSSIAYHWVPLERCWTEAPPPGSPAFLEIIVSPPSEKEVVWMHVAVDNREWASIPLEPGWCRYRIARPPGIEHVAGRILIEFEPAMTPAALGMAPDPRLLSARLHAMSWIFTAT